MYTRRYKYAPQHARIAALFNTTQAVAHSSHRFQLNETHVPLSFASDLVSVLLHMSV
jgi:hypothetical protein